jgi:hypothetical protein
MSTGEMATFEGGLYLGLRGDRLALAEGVVATPRRWALDYGGAVQAHARAIAHDLRELYGVGSHVDPDPT